MPLQFAPGWLQPGDTWHGTAIDLQNRLQQITDDFVQRVNPSPAFQDNAAEALAYNIQNTVGDVTVRRAPHQVERYRSHLWVHYTLRSARANTSYHLYLRTVPNDAMNFEDRVYVVSNNDLNHGIIWTGVA